MTSKDIRNLPLMTRLYNLFRTERSEFGASIPQLLNDVQPTVDIHKLNQLTKYSNLQTTATTATHDFIVPLGKVWHIVFCYGIRANTGANVVTILDPAAGFGGTLAVTSAVDILYDKAPILRLTEGWILRMDYAAGTSGLINSTIVYLEEDV